MSWERTYLFLGTNWWWILPGIGLFLFALTYRRRREKIDTSEPIDVAKLCRDLLETHRQEGDPDLDERDLMGGLQAIHESLQGKGETGRHMEALARLKAGDHRLALDFLQSRANRQRGRTPAAAEATRQLGALTGLTDAQAAFSLAQKAVNLDPQDPRAKLQLGTLYMRGCDLASAHNCFEEGHALAEDVQDQTSCAVALGNMGMIYQALDDPDTAETLHREALTLNQNLNREDGIAVQCGCLGLLYEIRGDKVRGERFLREARSLWEHSEREHELGRFFEKLADNSLAEINLPEAERYLHKVLAVREVIGDMSGIANCYRRLGEISLRAGNLESARQYWETAIEIFDGRNDIKAVADLRSAMMAAGL